LRDRGGLVHAVPSPTANGGGCTAARLCGSERRGYLVVEVSPEQVRTSYHHYDEVAEPDNPGEQPGAVLDVKASEHRIHRG